ncbi:tetratricopeptide repeat protein [Leptospira wolffii]|uniref:tetratricopeptide repeat protein n=1 Tax=Leptospira wolffii TaxID=409998 RepID=UPI0002D78C8F|nr:tetratricopeptide repeat protein [Leptospira wolffii]EPG65136.1 tetratricopeptide repeat protein [Leptospira wolffii serovar Khorat str. Khorat-H2]
MNRSIILVTGFLFVCAGLLTGIYTAVIQDHDTENRGILEKVREGEEFLKHSNPRSAEKALNIFSELSAKEVGSELSFRIKLDLASALDKTGDKMLALGIFRELNQKDQLSREEKAKVSYGLGNLLLLLNRDEEGKGHLEEVLRTSSDNKLRSNALSAIADYYMKKGNYEQSRKNYVLALQEDPENVKARVRWGKSLRRMGKDWSAYDVYEDYVQSDSYFDPDRIAVDKEFRSGLLEKGRQLYIRKEYHGAIETLKKALDIGMSEKAREQAWYYIAESYDALGKTDTAIQYLNKILENSDGSLDQTALFRKGTIYFRSGKYEKAASVFQEASERNPDSPVGKKSSAWRKEALDQIEDDVMYRDGDRAKAKQGDDQAKDEDDWKY